MTGVSLGTVVFTWRAMPTARRPVNGAPPGFHAARYVAGKSK